MAGSRVARFGLRFALAPLDASLRDGSDEFLDDAAAGGATPEHLYVYLYAVITGWFLLALAAGLAMVGLAAIGSVLAGNSGRTVGVAIGVGVAFFCVAGAADATWRSLFVYAAKRRLRRRNESDQSVTRWMQIARVDYPVLAVQAAVGIAAAAIAALAL